MKPATEQKKPAVSPMMLGILGVVVVAFVYFQFFSGPQSPAPTVAVVTKTPIQSKPVVAVVPKPANPETNIKPTSPQNTQSTGGSLANEAPVEIIPSDTVKNVLVSTRDPFSQPYILTTPKQSLVDVNPPIVSHPNQDLQVVPKPVSTPVIVDKPVWKGIIKSNNVQIVLVAYKNKNYLLQLGDRLFGSNYQLTEINSDNIIFDSPSGVLRLTKKEETKK